MKRKSPSTSPSQMRRKRRQQFALLKKKSHCQQKLVLVARLEAKIRVETSSLAGDSQSSQEQWSKADKKETRWKDVTSSFCEGGLQMKEKKSQSACLKESQKREDEVSGTTICGSVGCKQNGQRKRRIILRLLRRLGSVL